MKPLSIRTTCKNCGGQHFFTSEGEWEGELVEGSQEGFHGYNGYEQCLDCYAITRLTRPFSLGERGTLIQR